MTPQPKTETINIDGTDYNTANLTPEIRGVLSLLETTRVQMQEAQVDFAIKSAAYNQFGSQLREKLAEIAPKPARKVMTPRPKPKVVKAKPRVKK